MNYIAEKKLIDLIEEWEYRANQLKVALIEISDSPHGTSHCKLKEIADKALSKI